MTTTSYQNPIVRGMYPDPSIVRVDDTFYLVNSTFEYYPGIALSNQKTYSTGKNYLALREIMPKLICDKQSQTKEFLPFAFDTMKVTSTLLPQILLNGKTLLFAGN